MKKRATEKKHATKRGILISSLFGLCATMIILFALLMIFSLIGLATENPHSLLSPVSFFSIYTSTFFGGFISIKKNKGHDSLLCGLICGIFSAIVLSLVFGVFRLLFDANSTPLSWLFRVLIIITSIIGALLGVNKTKKMPKKKKRR